MRNRRTVVAGAVVLIAALAVLLLAWRPWQPPRSFAADELGYQFEYEFDPATLHMHQSNPDRDGKEYVGVLVQGHYSVMILDGNLSVSGEPRGQVKKGDRIKVTLDRRVWVNGSERRP
jgi:hypothetical protein